MLNLNQPNTQPFATADEVALMIDVGWTVLIPPKKAVEYVEKFNESPDFGFFRADGKVLLSHNSGKLWLSEAEADALVALIRTAYMGK